MKIVSLLSCAALAVGFATVADAKAFGPANGAIAFLGSPVVEFGVPTGSATFSSRVDIQHQRGSYLCDRRRFSFGNSYFLGCSVGGAS